MTNKKLHSTIMFLTCHYSLVWSVCEVHTAVIMFYCSVQPDYQWYVPDQFPPDVQHKAKGKTTAVLFFWNGGFRGIYSKLSYLSVECLHDSFASARWDWCMCNTGDVSNVISSMSQLSTLLQSVKYLCYTLWDHGFASLNACEVLKSRYPQNCL